jgi:hypothetical protein
MTGFRHAIVLGIGLFALALAGSARAQDLSAGKTPAQLFRLNCAMCHKSPRGLAVAGANKGVFSGLESFLAEHYTADPKSAEIIAAYLKSVGGAAPAHTRRHRRTATPHKPASKTETAKKADSKNADKKSEDADKTKSGSDNSAADSSAKSEGGKAKAEEPKVEKPAMAKPKAAATAADKKKPASPSTQAKDQKPVAGEKKTD